MPHDSAKISPRSGSQANLSPKAQIFEQFALVAKALGHGNRLELVEHMAQGERSVESLASLSNLSIANASQHLQRLRRAGLVDVRKAGTHIYYRLADDEILVLVSAVRRVAERNLAEVGRVVKGYYHACASLEPVSRPELLRRMREEAVTILDVRPRAEYLAGHVSGARNIAPAELKNNRANSAPGRRSSPIAGAPIVSFRSRPWPSCAGMASRRAGTEGGAESNAQA